MKSQIVVIGSLNADLVVRLERMPAPGETVTGTDFSVFPGGKGANQACAVARLGAASAMVGRVGADHYGEWLKDSLASSGVDVSFVQKDTSASSGTAVISVDAVGQNQIVIIPGANDAFLPEHLEQCGDLIASAGIVLLQLEIPQETVEAAARLAKASGATVILDPAPAQPVSGEILNLVDYLTPNETELAALTGVQSSEKFSREYTVSAAQSLRARGARKVIVKMGSLGALLVAEKEELFWPALPVVAIDTTAAGDAFNAAFAFALLKGHSEFEAGDWATAAAACSVTRKGAQPSLPTFEEVEAMLKQRHMIDV
ncbi:MAG TPA: ribokinase [Blastocatellia bacterium]|jgi:ribokinase|nr:ribokinase [Blastocatellia bacterium]